MGVTRRRRRSPESKSEILGGFIRVLMSLQFKQIVVGTPIQLCGHITCRIAFNLSLTLSLSLFIDIQDALPPRVEEEEAEKLGWWAEQEQEQHR